MVLLTIVTLSSTAMATDTESSETESPWLLTPTISSDPKLGSAVGFMGAYLKKFDDESPASMFGIMGSYSDTDSFFMALLCAVFLITISSVSRLQSSAGRLTIIMKTF